MIKVKEIPGVISDLVFLQGKIPLTMTQRNLPYGLMSFIFLTFLASWIGGDMLYLYAIPIMLFYATIYSCLMHLAVKDEFREPGSYALTVDNILFSLSIAMALTIPLSMTMLPLLSLLEVLDSAGFIMILIFSNVFFFYLLRLSSNTYSGVDLDHLFGANLIPFAIILFVGFYVEGGAF